jgi:multidrug efflux pump subunit AcrA (membrane-fusion protein)
MSAQVDMFGTTAPASGTEGKLRAELHEARRELRKLRQIARATSDEARALLVAENERLRAELERSAEVIRRQDEAHEAEDELLFRTCERYDAELATLRAASRLTTEDLLEAIVDPWYCRGLIERFSALWREQYLDGSGWVPILRLRHNDAVILVERAEAMGISVLRLAMHPERDPGRGYVAYIAVREEGLAELAASWSAPEEHENYQGDHPGCCETQVRERLNEALALVRQRRAS